MHQSRHSLLFVALVAASSLFGCAQALAGDYGRVRSAVAIGDYAATATRNQPGYTYPAFAEADGSQARGDVAVAISAMGDAGVEDVSFTEKVQAPPMASTMSFRDAFSQDAELDPASMFHTSEQYTLPQEELERLARLDLWRRNGWAQPPSAASVAPSRVAGSLDGAVAIAATSDVESTATASAFIANGEQQLAFGSAWLVGGRAADNPQSAPRSFLGSLVFIGVVVILIGRAAFFKGHPPELATMQLPSLIASKPEEKDPDAYAADFAPVGNIYRHLARDSEWRKHQENLHVQLLEIAARYSTTLDRLPLEQAYEGQDVEEIRCHKLVDLLRATAAQAGDEGTHLEAVISILGEAAPVRLGGIVLVPSEMNARQRFYKDRFMALIIGLVMFFGPMFIISSSWNSPDNILRNRNFEFSWARLLSAGATEALGTLLIILIFEFGRTYVVGECTAFDKMKNLPCDKTWARVGQITNMICVFTTMLAMPVIFLTEPYAKDMVFDSMAMLFIFTLDDLSNDVLSYLNMDDNDFRSRYVTMVRELQQVPVKLSDLVNKNATDASQIWTLAAVDEVLPGAGGEKRLYMDQGQLIYNVEIPDQDQGRPPQLLVSGKAARLIRNGWIVLYYVLTAGEVAVPIWFMAVS